MRGKIFLRLYDPIKDKKPCTKKTQIWNLREIKVTSGDPILLQDRGIIKDLKTTTCSQRKRETE